MRKVAPLPEEPAELEPEPWVEWLLYDHPSIGKRLEMGRAFQASGVV